jgi:hypothetical protein
MAGRDCPTYELYLLAVIAAIQDYYVANCAEPELDDLRYIRAAHGNEFPVFFHGPDLPPAPEGERYSEQDQWIEAHADAFRLSGAEGYDHPALRRDTYEFYRRRVLAEEQQRRLEDIVRKAVTSGTSTTDREASPTR